MRKWEGVMVFNDDDLKRLKDWAEFDSFLSVDVNEFRKHMPGLIARLEAAELCARYLTCHPEEQRSPMENQAINDWRKAYGKTGDGEGKA